MNTASKLGLGTVQWGMAYGITNQSGMTPLSEIKACLRLAEQYGIQLLDTAYAYGQSEIMIGEQLKEGSTTHDKPFRFQIVTKTFPLRVKEITQTQVNQVKQAFAQSRQRLHAQQIYGLLVHTANDLLARGAAALWDFLEEIKAQGQVRKIGVSVYSPSQLEQILEHYPIDIVQLPFSLYDQRFRKAQIFQYLKQKKIEIHARSIFLQGVLLIVAQQLPSYFSSIAQHQQNLHQQLYQLGLTPLQGCLQYAFAQPEIDRLIIGCESAVQLDAIIHACQNSHPDIVETGRHYGIEDEKILHPSYWPKKAE